MSDTSSPVPSVTKRGAAIPRIGLGTWQLRGETCARLVEAAVKAGYTHVDTAQGYANEAEVGDGLAASGVAREKVFITTKVRPDFMHERELQRSVEESLRKLRVDSVDLLLLHWPNPEIPLSETIPALNAVKRDGLAKHIGLSNFTVALLEEAWSLTEEPLAAEQIELHPFVDQRRMLAALRARDMAIIAYCPIALGRVAIDPEIGRIAAAHGRTPAQVGLRWLMQTPDVVAIPKTATIGRLKENIDVFDFELSAEEMAKIGALARPGAPHLVNEPAWVALWD